MEAVPAVVIAPVVEELFFRVAVLVATYQIFRKIVGALAAAVGSTIASSGGFVLLHAAFAPVAGAEGFQLMLLGITCSLTVLLTGRIWGAVLTHSIYNGLFLALAYVGSVLS
ncbi:CPBP family glutamic-type intramembrane protease [Microbacterium testaceum]|uniref:CPBP family glutamic-type intramembrane protease n=1 Tax=Microbacterium testaceum TaxID=2033 RepID=UPI000734D6C1|nr:CPBP family glutamic-type intramembrane protease [Microbacterium testaceum]